MKPKGPVFDAEWRRDCCIRTINKREGEELIDLHYLSQWPKQIQITFGLIRQKRKKLLGVITYSQPSNLLRERFGENTWELSRLILWDEIPKNGESFFIGGTIRYIKKEYSSIRTLITFADPKEGHSGIVYKASNWKEEEHSSKRLFVYKILV